MWEALCPDVRGLILSKLSLRELAHAAPTCREMRKEFGTRSAAERVRLISAGEEFLGKEMFSGCVRAFQSCMQSSEASLTLPAPEHLFIDAEGELHIGSLNQVLLKRGGANFCLFRMSGACWSYWWDSHRMRELQETQGSAVIWIDVGRVRHGQEMQVEAHIPKHAAAATMGLLLAICGGHAEAVPTLWERPLNTVALNLRGDWGVGGMADAEDLVGPLRSLARCFTHYDHLTPWTVCTGEERGEHHVASRLAVMWSAWPRWPA